MKDNTVTYRKVLVFWLPLAFSWLLMTFEGPWIQGVISRKPDSETQLAAFGLIFSLSVLIETPIIMLLATSSALSRNRQAYQVLWRFMMAINVLVTIIALLMAFTPLLDVYLGTLLNIPSHIIEATRPGMQIMVLWSAFIGYRRFHQGILIRFGHTRYVGYGSVIRIMISGGVAIGLGAITQIAGGMIGALSLILAVGAEAIYTYFISRNDVKQLLKTPISNNLKALTYRDALKFHIPLAMTSIITLLIRPFIERGLASLPDATQALAAWPVVFSIMLVMRSGGMAYQEVVISMNQSQQHHDILRGFTFRLGAGLTILMIAFAFTPLINIYNNIILDVPENLRGLVLLGTQSAIALPLLTTLQSYFRALLILSEKTSVIYQAMIIGFVITIAIVWGAISYGIHGILAASIGLTIGQIVELLFLLIAYQKQNTAIINYWQSITMPSVND
jgi:progressive ankylosis protein